MATQENTSMGAVDRQRHTFCHGMFTVSEGVSPSTGIDQASVFLASGIDGISDMVASGDVSCDRLWGYLRLIEAAKALIDNVA